MSKRAYFFIVLLLSFSAANAKKNNTISSAENLIKRVLPSHFTQFSLSEIPSKNGKDNFEITSSKDKIVLKGNNTIAIASALNWYLKYTCNANISWNGNQLNLPAKLPIPEKAIQIVVQPDYRVMFNYCTFSYSMVWWDWKRWEKELDFLAMNGINMPLTVVGLEAVWYKSLLRIGFTDFEARTFLVGPAYQAWQWMTNIESYAGPLPKSWIDSHEVLGKQILNRELELGMKPILQGFSGYVPRKFKEKFADARIQQTADWCNFEGCAQLDPLDPLFTKFGKIFFEEQTKIFGKHGFYAADPFHEGEPPQKDQAYLNAVGKTISNLVHDFDKNGTWVMQAWSIRKDIVEAVPKSKLLVLDLNGSKYKSSENFWGYPFVIGNLHNFGNRINLHGDIGLVASNQYANAKKVTSNAVGSGLFMEGIMQNPLYYDLAFEMPFHADSLNLDKWLNGYANRRYGKPSKNAQEAVHLLKETVYTKGTNDVENSSIIATRPALDVKKSGPNAGFNIPYNQQKLIKALDLLLADSDLKSSDGYRFDIVDIQRQILSNLGQSIQKKATEAFKNKDIAGFKKHTERFIALLNDVDKIASTRPELSFDKWVSDATKWGKTPAEKDLYDYNASMIVTQWGPDKERDATIFDYSWREWSGLIKGYYLPRWQKFFDFQLKNLENNKEYQEKGLKLVYGREALKANDFYTKLAEWEKSWINTPKTLKKINTGKELEYVLANQAKYKPLIEEYLSVH